MVSTKQPQHIKVRMDVTIPPHNLKRFASSITCLGRIGKDLYVSFDPLEGLTLSSLNEAKSAYGKFHFDPGFFTHCDGPIGLHSNNNEDDDDNDNDKGSKYVCRVPIRSVSSVLRSRKGVLSLQLRSEGADDHGNLFGMRRARKKASEDRESRRGGRRTNYRGNTTRCNRNDNDDDNEEEEEDENNEERDRRRRRGGSLSARERSRSRNARRREMRSRSTKDDENEEDESSSKRNVDKMMLSFEYHIEIPNNYDTTTTTTGGYPNNNNNNSGGGRYSIVHRVGVTDANGISLSTSIARQRTRSEIVSHPRLFLRLLDPLRRTAEVALTIDDTLKVVTATSFHPNELGGSSNTILQANAARNAVLKTETSTGAEEFDEYDFRSNRGKKMKKKAKQVSPDEGGSDNDDDDGCDNEGDDAPPLDVNQKVILVFSIKEAKAMMQYCAQTYNSSSYHDDDDDGVVLSFHWGGRPIVIETAGDYFTAELVLATLHHGMIASNIAGGGGGGRSE